MASLSSPHTYLIQDVNHAVHCVNDLEVGDLAWMDLNHHQPSWSANLRPTSCACSSKCAIIVDKNEVVSFESTCVSCKMSIFFKHVCNYLDHSHQQRRWTSFIMSSWVTSTLWSKYWKSMPQSSQNSNSSHPWLQTTIGPHAQTWIAWHQLLTFTCTSKISVHRISSIIMVVVAIITILLTSLSYLRQRLRNLWSQDHQHQAALSPWSTLPL